MALASAPNLPAVQALERGDAFYARRAEGSHDGIARTEMVDRAIAEYREAIALDPTAYEPRLALLRSFFFRGGFCGLSGREQIAIFDEAMKLSEQTVKALDVDMARRKGRVRSDAADQPIPAAMIYTWAAVSWGEWAVSHHVSAAFQRAPGRIRDLATAAIQIDPSAEQGGALVVLGRLHNECPRIPLLTTWVSRPEGTRFLRLARTTAPKNPANAYFLAEALLGLSPPATEEARSLLEWSVHAVPRPEYLVEDAHYSIEARALLAQLH
ncbi:MAG: hypothetical protein ABI672_19815 [Vicinamibacteria bacterium]